MSENAPTSTSAKLSRRGNAVETCWFCSPAVSLALVTSHLFHESVRTRSIFIARVQTSCYFYIISALTLAKTTVFPPSQYGSSDLQSRARSSTDVRVAGSLAADGCYGSSSELPRARSPGRSGARRR